MRMEQLKPNNQATLIAKRLTRTSGGKIRAKDNAMLTRESLYTVSIFVMSSSSKVHTR